jgi:membrane-bound ClpP family serine protease
MAAADIADALQQPQVIYILLILAVLLIVFGE